MEKILSNKYKVFLERSIGKGGFSTVYKGKSSKISIAAKRIFHTIYKQGHLVRDEHKIAVAEKEIIIYKRLQAVDPHRNVTQFIDCVKDDTAYWIILELCDLGDLGSYLLGNPPSLKQKFNFIEQCAAGLSHLHNNFTPPIIHGDIKPFNVLVKQERGTAVLKLSDFGSSVSPGSSVTGTRAFLPPEALKADYHHSIAGDIFSFGLLMQVIVVFEKDDASLIPTIVSPADNPISVGYTLSQGDNVKLFNEECGQNNRILTTLKTLISKMVLKDPSMRISIFDICLRLKQWSNITEPTFEEAIDEFQKCLQQCSHHGNHDKNVIDDKNLALDTRLAYCRNDKEIFNVDDSIEDTIKSWEVWLCTCGNVDAYLYELINQEGDHIYLCCKCCNKELKIGSQTKVADQSHVNSELPPLLTCKCGNNDISYLDCYQDEESDQIIGMRCSLCSHSWLFKHDRDFDTLAGDLRHSNERKVADTEDIKKSSTVSSEVIVEHNNFLANNCEHFATFGKTGEIIREKVDDACGVNRGDKLAWWRSEGYWHHAIVVDKYPETNEVKIVHFNGPSHHLIEEKVHLGKEKGLLYRLKYCYERDADITRAKSMLKFRDFHSLHRGLSLNNEKKVADTEYIKKISSVSREEIDEHIILANNCEHAAMFCNTGKILTPEKKGFVKENSLDTCSACCTAVIKAESAISNTRLLPVSGNIICKCIGKGTAISIEGISTIADINEAYDLKREGYRSKQKYFIIKVSCSVPAKGSASKGILRAYVSRTLIPVPFLGAMMGRPLSALISRALNKRAGYICA